MNYKIEFCNSEEAEYIDDKLVEYNLFKVPVQCDPKNLFDWFGRKITDNEGKIILTITKIFFVIVASALVGYNLFLINAKVFLKEKLPMPLGYGTAVVVSNSMSPTLEINDLIIVKETNDYETGDVIVYDDGKVLVVHRIVEIDDYVFIAKGDANNTNDRAYSVDLINLISFISYILRSQKCSIIKSRKKGIDILPLLKQGDSYRPI